jgi:hypothetical protein
LKLSARFLCAIDIRRPVNCSLATSLLAYRNPPQNLWMRVQASSSAAVEVA